jgi:hypothetical protein
MDLTGVAVVSGGLFTGIGVALAAGFRPAKRFLA